MSDYKVAYDKAGKPVIVRKVKGADGQMQWERTTHKTIEEAEKEGGLLEAPTKDTTALEKMDPRQRQHYLRNYGINKRYQEELAQRGPEAVQRAIEARQTSIPKAAMIHAGRETDKLLAGGGDVVDWLDYLVSGAEGQEAAMARTNNRAKEQALNDELFREFEENTGGTKIATTLPYLASGFGAGPASAKLSGRLIKGATDTAKYAGRQGRGLMTRGVEAAAKQRGPVGSAGKRMKKEWTDPLNRWAMRKKAQVKEVDPYRPDALKHVLGDTGLGAVEGALHYNMNPIEGAIASASGSSIGQVWKPAFTRAPDFYSQPERDLIEWGKDRGMKFLPGTERGMHSAHMFEEGLRSEKAWTDLVHEFDRSNDHVVNRTAYEAMGLKGKDVISPKDLTDHMASLKKEFQDLEMKTTGRFDKGRIMDMRHKINRLLKSKSPSDIAAGKEADAMYKEMMSMSTLKRDARGRFKGASFDGANYQDVRRRISNRMEKAYDNKELDAYNMLKEMRTELDDALARGIDADARVQSLGQGKIDKPVTSADWKDINERYAMSKLVQQHGMTPTGQIDLDRLSSHLLTTDAERLIQEQGGRIVPLQKMAKLRHMTRKLPGNANRTASLIKNPEKVTPFHAFLKTPMAGAAFFNPISKAYLGAYKKGWPVTSGLAGMNINDNRLWNFPKINRAVAMGTQVHPDVILGGIDLSKTGYDWTKEKLTGVQEDLDEAEKTVKEYLGLFDWKHDQK